MNSIEAINSIAQLGGTALAIAVLIYVLAFFRGEVKNNKKELREFVEQSLKTQEEMQAAYLEDIRLERGNAATQEQYIRELTKDMITVLNTNNGHLQQLNQATETSRLQLQATLEEAIEHNNKIILKRLLIIARELQIDTSQFIDE